jgi:hypothetical protein
MKPPEINRTVHNFGKRLESYEPEEQRIPRPAQKVVAAQNTKEKGGRRKRRGRPLGMSM